MSRKPQCLSWVGSCIEKVQPSPVPLIKPTPKWLKARPLPSSEAESGTLHWRRRLHPVLSVSPEHLGRQLYTSGSQLTTSITTHLLISCLILGELAKLPIFFNLEAFQSCWNPPRLTPRPTTLGNQQGHNDPLLDQHLAMVQGPLGDDFNLEEVGGHKKKWPKYSRSFPFCDKGNPWIWGYPWPLSHENLGQPSTPKKVPFQEQLTRGLPASRHLELPEDLRASQRPGHFLETLSRPVDDGNITEMSIDGWAWLASPKWPNGVKVRFSVPILRSLEAIAWLQCVWRRGTWPLSGPDIWRADGIPKSSKLLGNQTVPNLIPEIQIEVKITSQVWGPNTA